MVETELLCGCAAWHLFCLVRPRQHVVSAGERKAISALYPDVTYQSLLPLLWYCSASGRREVRCIEVSVLLRQVEGFLSERGS